MKSVSEDVRSWFIIYLEGSVSSPNPDATDRRKHNSGTVLYLEYYNLNYSRDSGFNWAKQILIKYNNALQRDKSGSNHGCEESVQETR
jgi:hypothetical protein